jgi:hypothetical protein
MDVLICLIRFLQFSSVPYVSSGSSMTGGGGGVALSGNPWEGFLCVSLCVLIFILFNLETGAILSPNNGFLRSI